MDGVQILKFHFFTLFPLIQLWLEFLLLFFPTTSCNDQVPESKVKYNIKMRAITVPFNVATSGHLFLGDYNSIVYMTPGE